jgi:Flp pilus assembly pilin Flp
MSTFHRMHRIASALLRDDRGQDLVEYGLVVAVISTVVILVMTQVGTTILNTFWSVIAASIPKV